MPAPAYTRLQVDERREQLLERATELFATPGYDELSMARIAREAGVSKPLLYHYVASRRGLFEAALAQGAGKHLRRAASDAGRVPADQLTASLDACLRWIEEHAGAYEKLMRRAGIPEVRSVIDRVREAAAQRIPAELSDGPPAAPVRGAVRGWLWCLDGVCLDWIRERDLARADVHRLLLGALLGALGAAGLDAAALTRRS